MTRRLAIVLLPAAAAPLTAADLDERIAVFEAAWDKFLRTYLGCPRGATGTAQCQRNQGVLDYAEFLKAAKAGRQLFDV